MSAFVLGRNLAPYEAKIARALRLRAADAPLLAGAVADGFVARSASMRSYDERRALLDWVADIAATYGDVPALRTVLEELPGELARAACDVVGKPLRRRDVDALAEDVRAAVASAWRPLSRAVDEPLDELDARIDALIVRLERRDPLSSEHSRAVAAWCARLGRTLGLSAAEIRMVSRCGLLHDVGKALTPLEVLNAPRALTEQEWKQMRAHAAAGDALVRRDAALIAFAPAVRSHHERLDGRGYPDGLSASSIPFAARLVAVADCFNAMIGRRPYRLPMAPSRALEELVRHRGTQFDAEIVDAMVTVVEGGKS